MNRFNFVGPAAQAISTFSAITSFTEGNRKLAKEQKQNRNLARDRIILEEASEVKSKTDGEVSMEEYITKNEAEMNKQIDIYAKRYGESNAEAGYKLNEGMRTDQGINTKMNAIRNYAEAQRSMDNYKAKGRDPQLVYNTFKDTSTPDLSTIRNKEQEV